MISPTIDALLVTFLFTFLLEGLLRKGPVMGERRKRKPRPVLAMGLLLGLGFMAGAGSGAYPEVRAGGTLTLVCVVAGGLALLAAGMKSDLDRPASRRHLYGTLAGGALLFFGGLGVPVLTFPLLGSVGLGAPASLLVTMAWVFLVVSMIELCALIPLVAGGVALLIGAAAFYPIPVFETFAGLSLCGALMGGVIGRSVATVAFARNHPIEKSEVLVLGYVAAAATLATFMKTVTLAGFILPFGLLVLFVILMLTGTFDRSLLLRAGPR